MYQPTHPIATHSAWPSVLGQSMTEIADASRFARPSDATGISAAILAGGASRRFGEDKALVPSPVDGRPILECIVDALRAISDDVTIIAPRDRSYDRFHVPVVSESHPGQGPLGGIEAALAGARHDRCLIVACDLPLLKPALLEWLAGHPFDGDALVPLIEAVGRNGRIDPMRRPQSLLAVYHTSILPDVRRLLAEGERRVRRLLDVIRVVTPSEESLRRVDPTLASFQNVNTPDDLASATRFIRGIGQEQYDHGRNEGLG